MIEKKTCLKDLFYCVALVIFLVIAVANIFLATLALMFMYQVGKRLPE